ncbi:MAG TPA: hypothetical protein VFK92_12830 [Burkholderiales bacterium]|nr:hypothetical protein [Burkholderiales bacterium]
MEREQATLSACRACVLLLLLPFAAHAGASSTDSSTMYPYVRCDGFAGGVRGVALDRRPEGAAPWREVGFGDKLERVSVVEGYRVVYSYPRTLWFATLKAERSDPAKYADDKRIVTENFTAIANGDDAALSSFSDSGFEGQTLTKRVLRGRTLGITQILSDDDAVIVTIYFANQAPENRAFQTHEEFLALRDDFVRGYIGCVTRRKAAPSLRR